MMRPIAGQGAKSKNQVKKRVPSANFNSKKIKSVFVSRQTCEQVIVIKARQSQNVNKTSVKSIHLGNKTKQNMVNRHKQTLYKKAGNKYLADVVKPEKHEKTQQEKELIRNCDKSKLLYWNGELTLKGDQKYLVLSADFILDQDCFWDRVFSDNGNLAPNSAYFISTLTTINNNALRYRGNKPSSANSIGAPLQSRKNPLLNPTNLTLLIKQWKSLHSRSDSQLRKLVVLWTIRRQASYAQLMQLVHLYQLPLHGVFYIRRKRGNPFWDLNPLIKEVHRKYFQAITSSDQEQQGLQRRKLVQRRQTNKCKSKYLNSQTDRDILKTTPQQLKDHFGSVTNRLVNIEDSSRDQENNQNSSDALNTQAFRGLQTSKSKRPPICITFDDQQIRRIIRRIHPSLVRSNTVQIDELIAQNKNQTYDKSPLIPQNVLNQEPLIRNMSIDLEIKQNVKCQKYFKPQFYIFQAIKCNPKDICDVQSYKGKIPILFNYHSQAFQNIKNKLSQTNKYHFQQNLNQKTKVYYFHYDSIHNNMLERANLASKMILKANVNSDKFTQIIKVSGFSQNLIQQVLSKQRDKRQNNQRGSEFQGESDEQVQLSEQQEELICQEAQKRLQQTKKKLIDDVISLKGRNYTFENGESIYYYVGNTFKRNYNLLYDQYYKIYHHSLVGQAACKGKKKQNVKCLNSLPTECSPSIQLALDKQKPLKLSKTQFYQCQC